jgi:hypothetical protein
MSTYRVRSESRRGVAAATELVFAAEAAAVFVGVLTGLSAPAARQAVARVGTLVPTLTVPAVTSAHLGARVEMADTSP